MATKGDNTPPWDVAGSHEQLFVLVTGANSGVGLGIAERLIDQYLATRSLSSHLILIPTTRSARKSSETIQSLRKHLEKTARTMKSLKDRSGPSYDPQDTINRVHLLSVQLDLCDLSTVYAAADQMVNGTITDPSIENGPRYHVPRLDSIVMNAGIGGFYGLDWPGLLYMLFTQGLIQMCTFPVFKLAHAGLITEHKPKTPKSPKPPTLGQIFCANVLGHYIFAHELLPLLSRTSEKTPPGRIIWTSSLEPEERHFNLDDFQGIKTDAAYESSKRITDLISLSCKLPAAKKYSDEYFQIAGADAAAEKPIRPSMYLTHPGIVHTTLFPLVWPLVALYKWALILCRWIGSPWHPVDGYIGAKAPVWMVLQDHETLQKLDAEKIKWGSSTDRFGNAMVKKTEVEGWGWEGKIEDQESLDNDAADGVLSKSVGRRPSAKQLTPEERAKFEEVGAKCWREMERLRHEWEEILGVRS